MLMGSVMFSLTGCSSSSNTTATPPDETTVDVALALNWTAVGDDGMDGTASRYDLRYATDSTVLLNNWQRAMSVSGLQHPAISGTSETFNVTLKLVPGETYYFALRTADEIPNWSGVSNVYRYDVPADDATE